MQVKDNGLGSVRVSAATGQHVCSDLFATSYFGVLTPYAWTQGESATVNVSFADRGGFDLWPPGQDTGDFTSLQRGCSRSILREKASTL